MVEYRLSTSQALIGTREYAAFQLLYLLSKRLFSALQKVRLKSLSLVPRPMSQQRMGLHHVAIAVKWTGYETRNLTRGPRGKRGGPAIPKKKFVRQFFNSDCQCKSFSCFMLTRFSRTIARNENIILLNGFLAINRIPA